MGSGKWEALFPSGIGTIWLLRQQALLSPRETVIGTPRVNPSLLHYVLPYGYPRKDSEP